MGVSIPSIHAGTPPIQHLSLHRKPDLVSVLAVVGREEEGEKGGRGKREVERERGRVREGGREEG
jgi:hypothetical protein